MIRSGGVFVGGTGTGVGKTVFSVLLITYLEKRGIEVAPMKPVETGCTPAPLDALALIAATSRIHPIETVCPYRLRLQAAPEAAAWQEGVKIIFGNMEKAFRKLRENAEFIVVEGAGGVATPYTRRLTGIEIAKKLGIPIILVTSEKLGTVGQTIASIRAIIYSRARCAGIVLSTTSAGPRLPHHESNALLVKSHVRGVPLLGSLPHMKIPGDSIDKMRYDLIGSWAKENLDTFKKNIGPCLDRILGLDI